ncbi:secretion protein F [Candidatus Merdisoma sp. JLR.KK011]|uniref:secretion protein F n=1 Tax=Candidatus Merdisoma sp. JLR.KK011 TaxID=3114299 RepID=UPI002FF20851
MKLSKRIWEKIKGRMPGQEAVRQNLKLLHAGGDNAKEEELYYTEKINLLAKVLTAGVCIAILAGVLSLRERDLKEGRFLPRQKYTYRQELLMTPEEGETEEVTVEVEPKELSQEESRALLDQTLGEMESRILGENMSLEEVRRDLKLIQKIEGLPIAIEWELDSFEVLNLDGSIRPEKLREEGSLVELTARLTCNKEEAVYRACAKILPPVLSEKEEFMRELAGKLEELQETGGEKEQKELPVQVKGKRLTWEEKKSSSPLTILMLTLICAAALYGAKDRELVQKTKERERQMCRDYAQIVSKLVLLMGAGTAVRTAWEMIVRDYQAKREQEEAPLHYAYEEMALALREMQNGVAEIKAYENFGLRCRIPCYMKLSVLLEQNLRKGNHGLTRLLKGEVQEAFEQRKELAVRAGEEAATRMLLPMILMLIVVMILILVPAGMSMQM